MSKTFQGHRTKLNICHWKQHHSIYRIYEILFVFHCNQAYGHILCHFPINRNIGQKTPIFHTPHYRPLQLFLSKILTKCQTTRVPAIIDVANYWRKSFNSLSRAQERLRQGTDDRQCITDDRRICDNIRRTYNVRPKRYEIRSYYNGQRIGASIYLE